MTNYHPYNVYKPRPLAPPPKSSGPKLSLKRAFWLGLALFIVIAGLRIDMAQRANARAVEAAQTAKRIAAIKALTYQFKGLAEANPQIQLSIAARDTRLDKSAGFQAYLPNNAASTGKLISAALYLNQVEKGSRSLAQSVDGMPAKQALQLMVQQSNDDVWAQLNDLLTHPALQTYAQGLQLSSYDAENNQISPSDMNEFLEQLKEGNLLNQAHTDLLLSFMQHTNYEDFISPALSPHATLYHKVGIDEDQVNDAAIIQTQDDTLLLSIMTNGKGTYDWPARAALIQKITHLAEQAYLD